MLSKVHFYYCFFGQCDVDQSVYVCFCLFTIISKTLPHLFVQVAFAIRISQIPDLKHNAQVHD